MNKARTIGMTMVKICGEWLPIVTAKARHRCEVCNGPLTNTGNRIHCAGNATHRGFITKQLAEERRQRQAQTANELSNFYTIKNGVVICQLKD